MADEEQWFGRAFAFLVIVLAIGDGGQIALRPQQSLVRAKLERRASLTWVAMGALRSRDEHTAPTAALLHMDQLDRISVRQCVENALDLVGPKLGILVDYDAPGRVTRMLSLVDGKAARHHLQHLVAAEKRIFPEHLDAVCLISHELKARTLGIENLAAADCEALSCRVASTQRIVDANESRAGFDFGKNPGRTPCLRVKRDAETPGDAASAMIVQSAVFAQELHAYTL